MYVLLRTDQGGGYVAKSGRKSSYTLSLQNAKTFPTREAAERERCVDNEVVLTVEEAMTRG